MPTVTVNVSFQTELLADIDAEAERESRSRSEILREAARSYIDRQRRWDGVFRLGDRLARSRNLRPGDVGGEIRTVRRKRRPHS